MEDLVIGHFQPDIVIILDADPEKVQHRMKGRADNNGFDERDMEFKKDVREGLLKRANRKTRTQYYIIDTVVHNEHQVEILLESIVKENHFLWKHEWCPEYRTYPYRAEIVQHIDILGEAEKNENS
jgi:thymidylate kinase